MFDSYYCVHHNNSSEELGGLSEFICVAREFLFSVPRLSVAVSTFGYTTQKNPAFNFPSIESVEFSLTVNHFDSW